MFDSRMHSDPVELGAMIIQKDYKLAGNWNITGFQYTGFQFCLRESTVPRAHMGIYVSFSDPLNPEGTVLRSRCSISIASLGSICPTPSVLRMPCP